MQNNFKVATIGGIEIHVNWTWLLAIVFFTWSLGDYYHSLFHNWSYTTAYILGAISGLLLFVTVLIHELSHSFTARANGLPVNSITLFLLGGVSNLTREPQTPRIELLVAIAGPLASLVLSGIFFLIHAALRGAPSEIGAVVGYLALANLLLAVFNLIPAFPLDGGRVLRAIVWMITGSLRRATRIASTLGDVFGYLFILGGLLEAFVLGAVFSGILLAFVGWFLHNAAGASAQQAAVDRALMGVDVRDVMDRPPAPASPTDSLEKLVYGHMLDGNQRAIPINGPDGRIMGLVTLSDIRGVPREQWQTTPAHAAMTPTARLKMLAPDEDLRTAMQVLAENNYHQLPVVDAGVLVGMLNRGHVVQYLHMRERLGVQDPSATTGQPTAAGADRRLR